MFITREAYEKALRRAKAEGRREALKEVEIRNQIDWTERNLRDSLGHLNDRVDWMQKQVCEVREMNGQRDSKAKHVCACKSGE